MYVPKYEFGWNRRTGWLHGDEASYNNAVALMKTFQPGRQRTRPIHPSWEPLLEYFDSNDTTRSANAFCDEIGLRPSTFSSMKCKPITPDIERQIKKWAYIGDGEGLDGSMNTNADRIKKREVQGE